MAALDCPLARAPVRSDKVNGCQFLQANHHCPQRAEASEVQMSLASARSKKLVTLPNDISI